MTKTELFQLQIQKPDEGCYNKAKQNWDCIAKPLDGLGDFEQLICKLAAIAGTEYPVLDKRTAVIFCADNGIVEEGVTQSPVEITRRVAEKLGQGTSSVSKLTEDLHLTILPVDIGICGREEILGVRDCKVAEGTCNFLKGPAMTEEQVLEAIMVGMELAKECRENGTQILSTGEMGIGNTTTSTAVLCALLQLDSDCMTGRGAGIDDAGLQRKRAVIRRGLSLYRFEKLDSKAEAFEILRCLGGLDIAGLVGLYIGAACYSLPIVIDGVISSTAAVLAERICPGVKAYMIASHRGREQGNVQALQELGLTPYINGNMALGEGTGAAMLFPILDMVLHFYKAGSVFSEDTIAQYERYQ